MSSKKPSSPAATAIPAQSPSLLSSPWMPYLLLLALAFVLYGNTLGHDYALDDDIVIRKNVYTQKGLAGLGKIFTTDAFEGYFQAKRDLVAGGRYRPLSIATFAMEWQVSPKNPGLSHFINVLLYALLGMGIFHWLRMALNKKGMGNAPESPWYLGVPFLVAALFMAHPIHTEVVANIKGRDEIMAMLFTVGALIAAFYHVDHRQPLWMVVGFMAFWLALLSKESPLPFILILPLSLFFFRREAKATQVLLAAAPVLIATAGYLLLRMSVVGLGTGATTEEGTEILNDPFLNATKGERLATVMETWLYYYGKLLAPISLSHDYYFNQIPVTTFGNPLVIASIALTLALGGLGVYWTLRGKVAGFGILFFFLAFSITSNLAVSIGTTMGERFVFLPSLGFLIALVFVVSELLGRMKVKPERPLFFLVACVVLLFSIRTIARNPAWKDNFTLFTTDVATCPNSAKLQTSAGGAMIERAEEKGTPQPERDKLLRDGIAHLQKAVEIYPEHGSAWLLMGNGKFHQGDLLGALQCFDKAINKRDMLWDAYRNAQVTSRKAKRFDLASAYYKLEIGRRRLHAQTDPTVAPGAQLWFEYANNYEEWGTKPDSAIWAYNEAIRLDGKMATAYGQMARVYGMQKGDMASAIKYGEQALALDPKLDWVYENVGIAHAMSNDPNGAIAVFKRGLAVNPSSAKLHKNIGIAYQSIGDLQNAQASFAKAKQLDPTLQ